MKPAEESHSLGKALRDVADESRLAYNWSRIEKKRHLKPHFSGRVVLATATALIAVGVVVGIIFLSRPDASATPETLFLTLSEWTPVMAVPSQASEEKRVTLSDGSCLTMAPGASLEVIESSAHRFEIELLKGWVRFSVTPGKERTWVIDAGLGRIVVIGTQFTVNRTPQAVKVTVHRGMVALHPAPLRGEIIKLSAGESRQLTSPYRVAKLTSTAPPTVTNAVAWASEEAQPLTDAPSKRVKASALPSSHGSSMPESPVADLAGLGSSEPVNALLKEVDEARKRKRPEQAAALLERILQEFPDDPARGLVALTLGRIHLDALHQPQAAAMAFKKAAAFKNLPDPLREQAYARCVEAFHRAGQSASARSMRDLYKNHFPRGAWLPWIEHWAGVE